MSRYTKIGMDGEIILIDEDAEVVKKPGDESRSILMLDRGFNKRINRIASELVRIRSLGEQIQRSAGSKAQEDQALKAQNFLSSMIKGFLQDLIDARAR